MNSAPKALKGLLGSRYLRWAVVVAAIVGGGYKLSGEWGDVHQALGQIGLVASLEALLALLVMQFATLRTWQVLLAGMGSRLSTVTAGRIFFIGQLGKYVPGSLWPVLTQMELGAAAKVPRQRSAGASILTMIVSLATGLLTAMVTMPFALHSTQDRWTYWFFLLLPVCAACLHPRILNPLLGKLFQLVRRPGLDQPVTGRVLLHALAWSFLAWIANGLQIWLLAANLHGSPGRTVLLFLGGYALAWCVGFAIFFAPAGAVFREGVLIALLLPVLGKGDATAVALASRAVSTISDLLVAGAAAVTRRRGLRELVPDDLSSADVESTAPRVR